MADVQIRSPLYGSTGTPSPFTAGPSGASRVHDAHGRYYDVCRLGNLFLLDSGAVTLAAANTSAGVLGTIKFVNGFYNPPTSGKLAVIDYVAIMVTSGTPTGGFVWNIFVGKILTNAATGTIRSAFLNTIAAGASVMTPMVNVILATVPADTATAGTQIGIIGGPAAVAAGAGIYSIVDDVAGRLIVPPGTAIGITQIGASTAAVQSTIAWEELPYLT
jgi:hypothetical protein